jgi:arachidonate 15-lipoxygenase
MSLKYDHSFAPYVLPSGSLVTSGLLPEPRWAAMMAMGQVRAKVGALAIRMERRAERNPLTGPVRRSLASALARLVPAAPGRIPTTGDAEFAFARFAGTNPMVIERARSWEAIPPKLRLDATLMAQLTDGGPSLQERVANGNVFVLSYDVLKVSNAADLQNGKFVAPANALFCFAPEMQMPFAVIPLAIECPSGRPDGETEVFTPLDGAQWKAAKRVVGVADVNHAELCLHLARAHFMTVPFAIALRRTLPREHALHQFLIPHLRFNLFVDRMAWLQGVRETAGVLVRSLGGTALWSQDVAKSVYYGYSFREQHFERDLEARGLADHPVEFPYRDDGRLLWSALRNFVSAYVSLSYANDGSVADDAALQAFVADATDPNGGNVRGLLAGDRLDTRAELVEILTQILFVAGPLHALAHYSSAAQLQDVDANPSWLTTNPIASPGRGEPGAAGGAFQYSRVVSTNCRYGSLGDFSDHAIGHREDCRALIAAFGAELERAEREIVVRNERRLAPFVHFLPSRIPNGITV